VETEAYFGRISKVPICMLASPDQDTLDNLIPGSIDWPKIGSCNFRYFERVPGFVEVKVASKDSLATLEKTDLFIGACICNISPASFENTQIYQMLNMSEVEEAAKFV
jgi:hypothetical protein